MKVRDISSVDVMRQRQKAIDIVKDFVSKELPANDRLSDDDVDRALDKLCDYFDRCADCSEKMLENFDTSKFFDRRNYKKPDAELKILLLGAFRASSQMEEVVRAMDDFGRHKMNGHTPKYLEQQELCDLTRHRLVIAQELYLTNNFAGARVPVIGRAKAAVNDVMSRAVRFFSGPTQNHSHG